MSFSHRIIFQWIKEGSYVLELGCGTGTLLEDLSARKSCRVVGLEISEGAIYECVKKGLNVYHGDIEEGLSDYSDNFFDYVIMDEVIGELKDPDGAISEALRVGRRVVISSPNFAFFPARAQLFFKGRAPVTKHLPKEWWETANIRFLSIKDFEIFAASRKIKILRKFFFTGEKQIKILPNFFAEFAIFEIERS